jgi:DNA-binding IclR family transcriptional regulator
MSAHARAQLSAASRKARPATERSLLLLEALANAGRPVSLKELAVTVGLPQATAFRLCQLLENERNVVREAGGRRYAVGVKLLRLGLSIMRASGPTTARHKILTELVSDISETCNLAALVGTDVVYLDRVEAEWPLRVTLEPGSRVPLHCTATGKLFLSAMPAETREQMLAFLPLMPHTPNSIVDKPALRRELLRIRKRGYSTDNEEFFLGLTCIAVPLRDGKGKLLAAIGCHAPKARVGLKQLLGKIGLLQQAARRLEKTFDAD